MRSSKQKVMNRQLEAIKAFFKAVEELKSSGVVRSHRYLGDIGEFICKKYLHLRLAKSRRQVGHDGEIDGKKVQVKYHGGKSTTVNCGDPSAYSLLLIVLGPKSVLRPKGVKGTFLVYQFASDEVIPFKKENGQYLCLKRNLPEVPVLRL